MGYIKNRLKEPSTWQGMIAAVTTAGAALFPEYTKEIAAVGTAVFSIVSVLLKDRGSDDSPKTKPS